MAIEMHVLAVIADSDSQNILFKSSKITVPYAPDGTELVDCLAIARAKLGTTFAEVEKDIHEQIEESLEGYDK